MKEITVNATIKCACIKRINRINIILNSIYIKNKHARQHAAIFISAKIPLSVRGFSIKHIYQIFIEHIAVIRS